MQKFVLFLSLSMLLIVGGCAGNKGAKDEAYDLRTDRNAPNYINNRENDVPDATNMSDRGKNKQHMVEDDVTDQNPNFLDLKRTGSGAEAGATNHGNDIGKAKQVIAATEEFEADSVWINGDRMWVSVYKKGMQTDQERIDAEARLHKKLIHALPRYNIEVRVKEDRR